MSNPSNPQREWGDVLDPEICRLMRCCRDMVGVGISHDSRLGIRLWYPAFLDDAEFDSHPTLYRTRKGALAALHRAAREHEHIKWHLTLWLAPEHEWDLAPLAKYLAMDGRRLPGTPRH